MQQTVTYTLEFLLSKMHTLTQPEQLFAVEYE